MTRTVAEEIDSRRGGRRAAGGGSPPGRPLGEAPKSDLVHSRPEPKGRPGGDPPPTARPGGRFPGGPGRPGKGITRKRRDSLGLPRGPPARPPMPIPSPFHERTSKLCTSYRWKDWSGYAAVSSYDTTHEREYFAFRESAGLLDVTPLYKYEVHGPDAAALLSRMMVRDVSKLKVDRVGYSCWCDDYGKVIDDGTVTRLAEDYYRVTAADPTLHWLQAVGRGLRVTIEDSSARLAAVALQGPRSREILRAVSDADIDRLKFFGATRARLDGVDVWITRTGYTGDLGYEVWTENAGALRLWDALVDAGRPHGIEPAGLDALDVSRIEAGLLLPGADYFRAPQVILEAREST